MLPTIEPFASNAVKLTIYVSFSVKPVNVYSSKFVAVLTIFPFNEYV